MANEKILVIEDDRDLNGILCRYLEKENYLVRKAFDGKEGVDIAREFLPELVLLDIMLPKIEGTEVCRLIRTFSNVPIMIISAKGEDMDKMLLLGLGADDYLTKPFSLLELSARVKSHLRRFTMLGGAKDGNETERDGTITTGTSQTSGGGNLSDSGKNENKAGSSGVITVDSKRHLVTVCGQPVELTAKEFKLLQFFVEHPGQVFSKEQLMDNVWGYAEFVDQNTVTVYIGRLREKLTAGGACYIKTVWGVGYKWEIS